MPLSMFQACVPPCLQTLGALGGVLTKAAAHAEAHRFDPAILLAARLYPTQFAFTRQVQVAADFAKGACARLSGTEAPKMDDTEATFPDLQTRLARTMDYVRTMTPAQLDGTEGREIVLKIGGNEMRFDGQTYLVHFVLPNLYFHATTAYAILRHNGVDLGKRDFIGVIPGMG